MHGNHFCHFKLCYGIRFWSNYIETPVQIRKNSDVALSDHIDIHNKRHSYNLKPFYYQHLFVQQTHV